MGTSSQEIVSRYTRTPRVGGARGGEREIKNSKGVSPPVVSPAAAAAAAAVCRHWRFHWENCVRTSLV